MILLCFILKYKLKLSSQDGGGLFSEYKTQVRLGLVKNWADEYPLTSIGIWYALSISYGHLLMCVVLFDELC